MLSGRTPGVALSAEGSAEAEILGQALAPLRLAAIHTSPVQRARDTAGAIAARQSVAVETAPDLEEVDFGEWAGQPFDALAKDPRWDEWNRYRATARCPAGETMAAVQARAVRHAERAAAAHPGAAIALVSHCDVIRAALAHWLGLSLDRLLAFDVGPASISRVALGPEGGRVLAINEAAGRW